MSLQTESRHFLREGDLVLGQDRGYGRVIEGWALYAIVEWFDGRREEVNQFEPLIEVVERANASP